MFCKRCNNVIESERIAVLGNTDWCVSCAKSINPPRVMGAMTFEHKTAPTVCIMQADHYKKDWKKYNPAFGRGSGVHKMSPRLAGTG